MHAFKATGVSLRRDILAMEDAGLDKLDQVYVANMAAARFNHQTAVASALVEARLAGEHPRVRVELEPWQILGGAW